MHLAVKQYIPLETPEANQRGVTILAAQANGFPKVRGPHNVSQPVQRLIYLAGDVRANLG